MQDPFLLDVTASEPLSMDQEIEMQQEWRDDERKCTFIILARDILGSEDISGEMGEIDVPPIPSEENSTVENEYPCLVKETLHAMIGDINLFLSDEEEKIDQEDLQNWLHNGPDENESNAATEPTQAELDIMIARQSHRHKGLGVDLALSMMHYGASILGIRRFFVKIKDTNISSLKLFREKLGFVQCAFVECFGEYELECKCETAADMVQLIEEKFKGSRLETKDGLSGIRLYDIYKCPLS